MSKFTGQKVIFIWKRKAQCCDTVDQKWRKVFPDIANIRLFAKEWVMWWVSLQPKSRCGRELLRVDEEEKWDDLCKGGPNGFFTLVVSLGWWVAANDDEGKELLDEMVSDVSWVLKQIIKMLDVANE